jgi:hypothetical protein
MVEAPNTLGVHPMSISYVYKVFQHLDMSWMGIWVRPYIVTPMQVKVDFRDRAEPKSCCNVKVEAPNPLGVHPTSISYE